MNRKRFIALLAGGRKTPWYLTGGIDPARVLAVYQPMNAPNLASGYVNIWNPGTYNINPLVVPTWDAVNGWKSDGTALLDTGISIGSGYAAVIRYSNLTADGFFFGCGNSSSIWGIRSLSGLLYYSGSAPTPVPPPAASAGVFGINHQYGYRNGVREGAAITPTTPNPAGCYIFGRNGSTPINITCYIQAIAFYSSLSEAEIIEVSNAINTLP